MPDVYAWEGAQHVYTTTIFGGPDGKSLTLVAVPSGLLLGDERPTLEGIAVRLGGDVLATAPDPAGSFLPHAVGAAIVQPDPKLAAVLFTSSLADPSGLISLLGSDVYSFAMHVVSSPIVGIEESRMQGLVLKAIIGFGGAVGMVVVTGLNAPILIAIAAGVGVTAATIIVVSTAVAIGERIYSAIAPAE